MPPPPSNALLQRASIVCQSFMMISLRWLLELDGSIDTTAAEQCLAAASFDRLPIVHDDLLALGLTP
jgi:hypothetical protein